jgi:hypothetical protein
VFKIRIFYQLWKHLEVIDIQIWWIFWLLLLKGDKINWRIQKKIKLKDNSLKSPANFEITWEQCPHIPKENEGLPVVSLAIFVLCPSLAQPNAKNGRALQDCLLVKLVKMDKNKVATIITIIFPSFSLPGLNVLNL